jgi:hypothetical protein
MTIPGECHKHIAHNEQQDSINSVCHFFNTSLTITAAKLQKKIQSTQNRLEFFYIHPKAFCRMRHTVLSNLPLGYAAWLIQECTQHRKFTEKSVFPIQTPQNIIQNPDYKRFINFINTTKYTTKTLPKHYKNTTKTLQINQKRCIHRHTNNIYIANMNLYH